MTFSKRCSPDSKAWARPPPSGSCETRRKAQRSTGSRREPGLPDPTLTAPGQGATLRTSGDPLLRNPPPAQTTTVSCILPAHAHPCHLSRPHWVMSTETQHWWNFKTHQDMSTWESSCSWTSYKWDYTTHRLLLLKAKSFHSAKVTPTLPGTARRALHPVTPLYPPSFLLPITPHTAQCQDLLMFFPFSGRKLPSGTPDSSRQPFFHRPRSKCPQWPWRNSGLLHAAFIPMEISKTESSSMWSIDAKG